MSQRAAKPAWQKKIANERIKRLFELAEEEFQRKPENSRRYVRLARKIAMRYNVKISSELKRRYCSKCSAYLKYGVNARVRVAKKMRIAKCLECGNTERIPALK